MGYGRHPLQFAEGTLLLLLLPRSPDVIIIVLLITAISAAAYVVWRILSSATAGSMLQLRLIAPVLAITLISMLSVRQHFQDMTFLPFIRDATVNSSAYQQQLQRYQDGAIGGYMNDKSWYITMAPPYTHRVVRSVMERTGTAKVRKRETFPSRLKIFLRYRSNRQYLHTRLREVFRGTRCRTLQFLTETNWMG